MFEFLVGDIAVVAGALMALIAFWRLFPFAIKRILSEQPDSRRYLHIGLLGSFGAAVLWIAVFDNWRQVIGIPTGWIQDDKAQRASDPFYSGDISDPVRAVSVALFFVAVIAGAYFFARYSRGYAEPLLLGPTALVSFFVLNTLRLRYDVDSVRIAYGTIETPLEVIMTLLWIAALWFSMGLIVVAMYLMLWAPVALLLSFIYRRFIDRRTYVEPDMYRRLRERRVGEARQG